MINCKKIKKERIKDFEIKNKKSKKINLLKKKKNKEFRNKK